MVEFVVLNMNKPTKTELHAELIRLINRIKFLRAAYYGDALPKQVSTEIRLLLASKEFVLSELKK